MTDVLCRDCKWMGRRPDGSVSTGVSCLHPASLAVVHLVTGEVYGGYMLAGDMRSARPNAWRQTYCGLDGTLFEADGSATDGERTTCTEVLLPYDNLQEATE